MRAMRYGILIALAVAAGLVAVELAGAEPAATVAFQCDSEGHGEDGDYCVNPVRPVSFLEAAGVSPRAAEIGGVIEVLIGLVALMCFIGGRKELGKLWMLGGLLGGFGALFAWGMIQEYWIWVVGIPVLIVTSPLTWYAVGGFSVYFIIRDAWNQLLDALKCRCRKDGERER